MGTHLKQLSVQVTGLFHLKRELFHLDGDVFQLDGDVFQLDGELFHLKQLPAESCFT